MDDKDFSVYTCYECGDGVDALSLYGKDWLCPACYDERMEAENKIG